MQQGRIFTANCSSYSGPLQEDPSIFKGEDIISLSLEYYDRWVVGFT
jgi:hypothetical protein